MESQAVFQAKIPAKKVSFELPPRALESEDNAGQDYRDLLESLYASLLRNSSSISSKGGKINADSFLSQNTVIQDEPSGQRL